MTKEDLLKFCCLPYSGRTTFEAPWTSGDYTFATNGHLIVRVPRLVDVPENPDAPKTDGLFPYAEPKEWFALTAITLPEMKKVVCSQCNGEKVIRHDDCSDCDGHECENCDGTGTVTIKTVPFKVGDAHYQLQYLHWLKDLPNCKLGPVDGLKQAPFQFDGGDGLIMPMRV